MGQGQCMLWSTPCQVAARFAASAGLQLSDKKKGCQLADLSTRERGSFEVSVRAEFAAVEGRHHSSKSWQQAMPATQSSESRSSSWHHRTHPSSTAR
jgi:hypothetical protein